MVHADPLPAEQQNGQPGAVQRRNVTFYIAGIGTIIVPEVHQSHEVIETVLEEHGRIRISVPSGQITTVYRDRLTAIISVPSASPNDEGTGP